jgi:hypothetical protein
VTIHGSTHDEVHTTAFEQGKSIQVSIPLPQNSAQATAESLKEIKWIHVSRWLAGWGQQGGQVYFLKKEICSSAFNTASSSPIDFLFCVLVGHALPEQAQYSY